MHRILRKYLIFILILVNVCVAFSQTETPDTICKKRLPDEINRYQPTIVPVLTSDSKYIFMDRKSHPDNTGSTKDQDDIWFSLRLNNNNWTEARNLNSSLNTKNTDVLFSITPDGTTALLYGIYQDNPKKEKQPGFSFATRTGDFSWSKPVPLNIKNYYNDSSHFYANMSYDKKVLIIAAHRKESYGNLDLYISFLDEATNVWSEPENLGISINTSGCEEAPYLAYDNKTLYFASDSRKGYGKLDLYITRRLDDTWKNWTEPVNLGPNINTSYDDTGVCLTALADSLIYVSSDTTSKRQGLYFTCLPKIYQPEPYLIVRGHIYKESLEQNNLVKENIKFIVKDSGKSDTIDSKTYDGSYLLILQKDKIYNINFSINSYDGQILTINTNDISKPTVQIKDIILIKKGSKSSKTIIYFDFDNSELSSESLKTIDKLISEVRAIKEMNIKLIGHTDTSGTEKYNFSLSQNRAQSVYNYLISKSFNPNKIRTEAKGSSQPISNSDNENRCVEIIIE